MDIVKYPLTNLSAEALLDRLEEEASELIHAIVKRRRFGIGSIYPRTGETAEERIIAEANDINIVLAEFYQRLGDGGSLDPLPETVRGLSERTEAEVDDDVAGFRKSFYAIYDEWPTEGDIKNYQRSVSRLSAEDWGGHV